MFYRQQINFFFDDKISIVTERIESKNEHIPVAEESYDNESDIENVTIQEAKKFISGLQQFLMKV